MKGQYGGLCNRSACLAPGPTWWNPNTLSFYCYECAILINRHVPLDRPGWRLTEGDPGAVNALGERVKL